MRAAVFDLVVVAAIFAAACGDGQEKEPIFGTSIACNRMGEVQSVRFAELLEPIRVGEESARTYAVMVNFVACFSDDASGKKDQGWNHAVDTMLLVLVGHEPFSTHEELSEWIDSNLHEIIKDKYPQLEAEIWSHGYRSYRATIQYAVIDPPIQGPTA